MAFGGLRLPAAATVDTGTESAGAAGAETSAMETAGMATAGTGAWGGPAGCNACLLAGSTAGTGAGRYPCLDSN